MMFAGSRRPGTLARRGVCWLASLGALLASVGATPTAWADEITAPNASDFTLPDLQGREHRLAELRRHGHVLLIFWATECVYCHAMLADFKRLYRRYAGKGLTLAAINIGAEHNEEVADYVKENAVPYLVLSDRVHNLDVAEAYRVIGTPTLVLVSPAGRIIYRGHTLPDIGRWLPAG